MVRLHIHEFVGELAANSVSWVGFVVVCEKFVVVSEKFADKMAVRRPPRIFHFKWKIRLVRRTEPASANDKNLFSKRLKHVDDEVSSVLDASPTRFRQF